VSTIGLTSRQEQPVEALYRKYSTDVLSVARRGTSCRADAEDVSQTAFMNAHKALLHGVRPANERAWLLAIARNVCRKRTAFAMTRPREAPLDEAMLASAPESSAARDLDEALARLSPRHRLALSLHDLEGRPRQEVEARLGATGAALDAVLFRARRALREELTVGEEPLGCNESRALVKLHLERELGARELDRLRAHLRTCDDCATAARRLRARRRLGIGGWWWGVLPRLLPRGARVAGDLKVAGAVGAIVAAGGAGVVATPVARSPVSPPKRALPIRHSTAPATDLRHLRISVAPTAAVGRPAEPPLAVPRGTTRVSVPAVVAVAAQQPRRLAQAPAANPPVTNLPATDPATVASADAPVTEPPPADTPGAGAGPGAPAGAAAVSADVSPGDVAATASVDVAAGPATVAATATGDVTGTGPTPGDVAYSATRVAGDVQSTVTNVTAQVTGPS